jgi:hypothetical protein
MIPLGLPRGTPIICIDNKCAGTLRKGKVYRVGTYSGGDFVHILRLDGDVSGGWCTSRFDVASSPDGADYQTADDVDLVSDSQ